MSGAKQERQVLRLSFRLAVVCGQASVSPLHGWCLKCSHGSALSHNMPSVAHGAPGQKASVYPHPSNFSFSLPFFWILLCYIWINCKSPLITHSLLKQTTCCHVFDYWIPGEFLFVMQPVTVHLALHTVIELLIHCLRSCFSVSDFSIIGFSRSP